MGNHRILIVDDDPLNTATLCEIFTLNGYSVDAANSGAEALIKIKKTVFSCILSDIKMEHMNGVELLRVVRATHPAIPFILMTAYTDHDLIIEGIKAGALVTLIKPLDVERLLGHIAHILKIDMPH